MRDAFGGTFMINILLVFIIIYVCFIAMSLNYAKAFKVKNKVVEYLESSEIINLKNLSASQMDALNEYFNEEVLGNMNYDMSDYNICQGYGISDGNGGYTTTDGTSYCHESGIIIDLKSDAQNTEGVYYTVSTYVGWRIPFLNNLLALNGNNKEQGIVAGAWRIAGETRVIVNK